MPTIRGRLGQYQVLRQAHQLSAYVVPTVRLTQHALFLLLTTSDAVILKSVINGHRLTIHQENELFIVTANDRRYVSSTKEAAFLRIQQHKDDHTYVMQPLFRARRFWRRPHHRYLTLQKRAGRWEVTSSTTQQSSLTARILFKLYHAKIKKIAQIAAETLHRAYPNCEAIVLDMSVNVMGQILIHDSALHFSVSKWNQYQVINSYMPATDLLTPATFQHFLSAYETVYIKPCNGQHGRGIVKIARKNGQYEVHRGTTKQHNLQLARLLAHLLRNDCFIIQQGIALATIAQSVFDVRVLMKKRNGRWYVHGKAVKVAGDGFFVTNAAKAVLRLQDALQQSTISVNHHAELDARLDVLCTAAALALDQQQVRTIIGFDVGVTASGELQIIEGNYMPDLAMFHQLQPSGTTQHGIR